MLRRFLGKGEERFVFVLDADAGLALAFVSAFAPWITAERVDVAVVSFDKHQSDDARNALVSGGRAALEILRSGWAKLSAQQAIEQTDLAVERLLCQNAIVAPFSWPFLTKMEPPRKIRLLTDRIATAPDRRARLMRLAILRSVDAYVHKVRSNSRFAARPAHTPSGNGRAWDRHYLYNPETMVKIIEIYRFVHNWMGRTSTKATPAMKVGLARGKMDPKDFFA